MDDILALIRKAAHRLEWGRFLSRLSMLAMAASGLAALVVIAGKITPVVRDFIPSWAWLAPALGGVTMIAAFVWWMQRRLSTIHVAIEVDQRLELNERFSTALLCRSRTDPFAQAAIDDAIRVSHEPTTREQVRRQFRIEEPRRWWISPALWAFAVLAWLIIPNGDLFASKPAQPQLTPEQQTQINKIQEEYEATVRKTAEQLKMDPKELKKMLGGAQNELPPANEQVKDPEQFQRESFKKLSKLSDELQKRAEGDKARTVAALQDKLSQLQQSEGLQKGPVSEMAKDLAKGDFAGAQKALEDLKKEMNKNGGKMSPEQKQAMEQLAQQLENLAQENKALEEQLKQAGIDPKLAGNPQALKQALEQNQNLTQQQKQQLQQSANAAQQAAQACQNMGHAASAMAGGQQGDQQQQPSGQQGAMSGAQQMGDQLSAMEMAAQQMQGLNAALSDLQSQCQGMGKGLGQGQGAGSMADGKAGVGQAAMLQWLQQQSNGTGSGQGQHGRAFSNGSKKFAARTTYTDTKEHVDTDPNSRIIGTQFIQGNQLITGQSQIRFGELVKAAESRAKEELRDNQMPAQYDPAIKHYFGTLKEKSKTDDRSGSGSAAKDSDH